MRAPYAYTYDDAPEPPREPADSSSSVWLWAMLIAAATAAVWFWNPFSLLRSSAPAATYLPLRATDNGGRMRVEWDVNNVAIRRAEGATLEVVDGNAIHRYPVKPQVLASGSFDYLRKSEDVLLKLELFQDGRPTLVGMIRSIGAPGLQPPTEGIRNRQTAPVVRRSAAPARRSGRRR